MHIVQVVRDKDCRGMVGHIIFGIIQEMARFQMVEARHCFEVCVINLIVLHSYLPPLTFITPSECKLSNYNMHLPSGSLCQTLFFLSLKIY